MSRQVTLRVLAVLTAMAACQGYPTASSPYQVPPRPQLLLPRPYSPAAGPVPVLTADASTLAKLKKYTQAGLPLPPGGQVLLYQPGGPGTAPFLYAVKGNEKGEEEEEQGGGGTLSGLYNFFVNWWESTTQKPNEEGDPASSEMEPSKVSEGQGSSTETASANLESFDEDENTEPTSPAPVPADPKQPEQKLFLIGQPQFFGNYDALKNPEIVKELGSKNPFPHVLLANGPQPFAWPNKYAPVHHGSPGKAAAEFQKLLAGSALTRAGDGDSVVVDALRARPHAASSGSDGEDSDSDSEDSDSDSEGVGAAQAEPAVAQVRPQAIALAGPSGVAAAAPVGTAVVGRGGLAVAAPSATAVAGPSGGEPPLVVPASRAKHPTHPAYHRFLERADDEDYSYSA
ncbi:uncharacterized protein LOC134529098 [Bacillus rossius redtenbacheri]|uniref:uncharacterized protein LOC134529098 n=1 Tax=Bacillus rossius redtenbacheri TaxID=93214 RepID=UPI002FDE0AB6